MFLDIVNNLSYKWYDWFAPMVTQNTIFLVFIIILLAVFKNHDSKFLKVISFLALLKLLVPIIMISETPNNPAAIIFSNKFFPLKAPVQNITSDIQVSGVFIAFLCYLLGFLFFIMINLMKFYKIFKMVRIANKIDVKTIQLIDILDGISIYKTSREHSPFVYGLLHPKIIVPKTWDCWNEQERRTIAIHEIAHIKQKDHWLNLLQFIVQHIYYFNPIVWIFNIKINCWKEINCDNIAIAKLNHTATEYSNDLLNISEKISKNMELKPFLPRFANSYSALKERIKFQLKKMEDSILKKTVKRSLAIFIFLILMILSACKMNNDSIESKTENVEKINNNIEESKSEIAVFENLSIRPVLVKRVAPIYPKEAIKSGINGMVTIKVLIDREGKVEKAEVLKSIPELDNAALEAVKQYVFKPAQINDQNVKVWMAIPIVFKLN